MVSRRLCAWLLAAGGLLLAGCHPSNQAPPLNVLCAPAMRRPVEKLLARFEQQAGLRTQVSFEASGVLLGQLKIHTHGDVLIPADRSYTDTALGLKLVEEPRPLAWLTPVMLVRRGNPHGVQTLADLARPGLKVGVGNERTAAIGRATAALLKREHLERIAQQAVLHAEKVDELGNALKLGALDATIVWDVVAANYPQEGQVIALPAATNPSVAVTGAVISSSGNKPAARRFLDLATDAAGRAIFAECRFRTQPPPEEAHVVVH